MKTLVLGVVTVNGALCQHCGPVESAPATAGKAHLRPSAGPCQPHISALYIYIAHYTPHAGLAGEKGCLLPAGC